ncbi:hypothetical protein [Streptomyces sp. NPDC091299]|uniref:hypothetical protein n=1 Tax=Streptomyces sp. NPDC091299 TaxID=3155302 RepID=UPI003449F37F
MAIFGKDNSDLLNRILSELAALRQQVTDQQHAIDRGETAARDHLNDTREVVRRALGETRETLISQLAAFSSDLATIRANTQHYNQTQPADPEAADNEVAPVARDDSALLQAAAGIAHATIEAHRDTWAFLVEHAGQNRHFHIPGKVDDHDGAVHVRVSGPSLVAAITSLGAVSRTAAEPGTRAIAGHLHQRITDTVRAVIDSPHSGNGADPVTIVIDDRAKPASEEQ